MYNIYVMRWTIHRYIFHITQNKDVSAPWALRLAWMDTTLNIGYGIQWIGWIKLLPRGMPRCGTIEPNASNLIAITETASGEDAILAYSYSHKNDGKKFESTRSRYEGLTHTRYWKVWTRTILWMKTPTIMNRATRKNFSKKYTNQWKFHEFSYRYNIPILQTTSLTMM